MCLKGSCSSLCRLCDAFGIRLLIFNAKNFCQSRLLHGLASSSAVSSLLASALCFSNALEVAIGMFLNFCI